MTAPRNTSANQRPSPTDVGIVERAKVATALIFVFAGGAFATWASRIPDVRAALDLTPGQLGILLLFGSSGSLVGLPLAGWVASRIGTRNTVLVGAALALVGLVGAGVGAGALHSFWVTAVFLFMALAGIGQWDVAMNLEGAAVEHQLGRNVMPRFHAAFSGGTVGSALVGAGAVALGVPFVAHFAVLAVLLGAGVVVASRAFLPAALDAADDSPHDEGEKVSAVGAWREPRTLLIGLVMLVAAFTEGTANDWLAVAFHEGHQLPTWAGVLAFATFLTCMTVGRIVGTSLLDEHGRVPVLRVCFTLAIIGSAMVIFGNAWLAFVGAAIWGVGASLGFPVGMSAAADDQARAAARMSVIATIGYAAFLAGPPLLGFLGDHWGVLKSLTVVGAGAILALLIVPVTREPQRAVDHAAEPAQPVG